MKVFRLLFACLICLPAAAHAQFGQLKEGDLNKTSDLEGKEFNMNKEFRTQNLQMPASRLQDRRANLGRGTNSQLQNKRFQTDKQFPTQQTTLFDGREFRTTTSPFAGKSYQLPDGQLPTNTNRTLYDSSNTLPVNDRVAREQGRMYDGPEMTRRTATTERIRIMLDQSTGDQQLSVEEIRALINDMP